MKSQRPRRRTGAGSGRDVWRDISNLAQPAPPNNKQPLERHFLADDKLVLFALAPVQRLVGTWQGPGTIAELRRVSA